MLPFFSNEMKDVESIISKNDSNKNNNNYSLNRSKNFHKAHTIISINQKKPSSIKDENKVEYDKNDDKEKKKNKTYLNNFYKIIPKSKDKTFNLKLDNRGKTSYSNIKNIKHKKNHLNNYYVTGNVFHNDYITDYLQDKHINQDKNKRKEKMKETDEKIEELVNVLNIYPNKKIKKFYPHKLISLDKTENDKNNTKSINTNENDSNTLKINKQNNKDISIYASKSNKNILNKQKSEKIMIKGTKIISPFCDFARDHYLYKKIFYYSDKKKNLKSESFLDNKLNIIYAENEKQYRQNLIKLNEIYQKIGKNKIYNLEASQSESKLRSLRHRVEFMKRIVDYTYPNMVLTKIREQEKKIYAKNNNLTSIITSKIKRKNYVKFNAQLSLGLKKSFNIQKCSLNADKKSNKLIRLNFSKKS